MLHHLVGVVEEVNGYTERQGVVIGIPQQDGQDLHAGRPGLPLALLLGPLQGALAVDRILAHLSPEKKPVHISQSLTMSRDSICFIV